MSPPVVSARRIVPILSLLFGGIVAGAGMATARGHGCGCGTLADEFRAADAGLVREWIVQVPFDSAGWRLEDVVVGDGLVLARSGDGGIHAIRSAVADGGRAGTVAWSRTIGAAAGQAWPPTVGTRLVVVASELAVHALDRESGVVEWERPTGTLTAASAVQSGGWVYVPLQTRRLLRLPVNPLGRAEATPAPAPPAPEGSGRRQAAAPPTPAESLDPVSIEAGGACNAAPVPLPAGVLWTTDAGLRGLERTPLGWIRHQLPERDPPTWERQDTSALAGPPALRDGAIFVATAGGGLARIDLNAPNRPGLHAAWAAYLPDRATSGPLVSGDVVIVAIGPSGIVAHSVADGRERWRSDLVGTLVAAAGGRAWLLDRVGRLTALDLADGSRRHSACVGCFTIPVFNAASERLVLASPGGLVVSLAPPATAAPPRVDGAPAAPVDDDAPAPPVNDDAPPPDASAPADPDATPP